MDTTKHPLHGRTFPSVDAACRACEKAGFSHQPHTTESPEIVYVQGPVFVLIDEKGECFVGCDR